MIKKIPLLLFLLGFIVACNTPPPKSSNQKPDFKSIGYKIANRLKARLPQGSVVAIVPFSNEVYFMKKINNQEVNATLSAMSGYITEGLINDNTNDQIEVVDQTQITNALKILKMQSSDLFTHQHSATTFGNFVNATAIVTGKVTYLKKEFVLSYKCYNLKKLTIYDQYSFTLAYKAGNTNSKGGKGPAAGGILFLIVLGVAAVLYYRRLNQKKREEDNTTF